MLPYGHQSISDEDVAAVVAALRGEWLTTGPRVDEFEAAVSRVTGGHDVISCTSGTAALHVAYAALGIGAGDEVVVTPMTFVATASCASMLGAKVVFADIDITTGLIDPRAVDACVSDRTKVVAAVDYAGQAADYDVLNPIVHRAGAVMLDDAAHSIGGTYKGRPVGDLADVTTLSFFPTKNVTTCEGGAVVCQDADVATRAREFHRVGMVRDPQRFRASIPDPWHQEVHEFGLNYRLNDVMCALGQSQLTRLPQFKARRTAIRARYLAGLAGVPGLEVIRQMPDTDPAWHLFPVRILDGRRREVYEALKAVGIASQVNYMPVYWHPAYEDLGYQRGLCPQAEAFSQQELSLPMFPDLTDAEVDRVVEVVVGVLR